MSTEENKALIRRWLEAWSNLDLTAIENIFDRDYTVNEVRIGSPGVQQSVQALHAALSPVTVTLEDVVAEADKVVVRWTAQGIHHGAFMGIPPTGRPVRLSGINIYRVANGRIVANHEQVGMLDFLQQLGGLPSLGQSE